MFDDLPINLTDLVAIAVITVSAILAFARGLVREVLSIAAWAAAIVATIYGFPVAKPFLREYIAFTLIADILTGASIFLVTLIISAAIAHVLSRNVRDSAFGALDRSLGLLYGAARGAVLLCLAYLVVAWALPEEERPAWITEARSLPLIVVGADWLSSFLPESAVAEGTATASATKRQVEQVIDAGEALRGLSPAASTPAEPAPANPPASEKGSGYNDDERKQMDRLIQGIQ